jgi:hypothetical protein
MGAFKAYETQKLKYKFQDMSKGPITLVKSLNNMARTDPTKESLNSIANVIDLMAKYNPGLLQVANIRTTRYF